MTPIAWLRFALMCAGAALFVGAFWVALSLFFALAEYRAGIPL